MQIWAILARIYAATISLASSFSSSRPPYDDVLAELASHPVHYVHPLLSIDWIHTPGLEQTMRGVLATDAIQANTILQRTPMSAALCADRIARENPDLLTFLQSRESEDEPHMLLTLMLMMDMVSNPSNAYLASFPTYPVGLAAFPTDFVDVILSSPIAPDVRFFQSFFNHETTVANSFFSTSSFYTPALFRAILSQVVSRSFGVIELDTVCLFPAFEMYNTDASALMFPTMVCDPWASLPIDALNHHVDHDDGNDDGGGDDFIQKQASFQACPANSSTSFFLLAPHDINPNEEVLLSYGTKRSLDHFLHYGFVMANNTKSERVQIRIRDPHPCTVELWQDHGGGGGDGGADDARSIVISLHADDGELAIPYILLRSEILHWDEEAALRYHTLTTLQDNENDDENVDDLLCTEECAATDILPSLAFDEAQVPVAMDFTRWTRHASFPAASQYRKHRTCDDSMEMGIELLLSADVLSEEQEERLVAALSMYVEERAATLTRFLTEMHEECRDKDALSSTNRCLAWASFHGNSLQQVLAAELQVHLNLAARLASM